MSVDGINIYTKAHVTNACDQVGRIYIGQEEIKVRQIGNIPTLEQDAVHIGCEADLAAHSVKRLLDTGAVVSAMHVSTWTTKECANRQISGWLRPIRVQFMWSEGHPSSRCNWEEGISGWPFWLSKIWRVRSVHLRTRIRATVWPHSRRQRRVETNQRPREEVWKEICS